MRDRGRHAERVEALSLVIALPWMKALSPVAGLTGAAYDAAVADPDGPE